MRPATQTSFENPSRSRSDVSGLRPVGRDARDAAPDRCCEFKILTNLGRAEHRRHHSLVLFTDGGQANVRTRCVSSLKLSAEGRV